MDKALKVCFKKYTDFSGRASRSEYWYFYLGLLIVYFVGSFLIGLFSSTSFAPLFAVIFLVAVLAFFIPLVAVEVRRMHDTNHSGWFVLIPIYGFILTCTKGDEGANRYGEPSPLQ